MKLSRGDIGFEIEEPEFCGVDQRVGLFRFDVTFVIGSGPIFTNLAVDFVTLMIRHEAGIRIILFAVLTLPSLSTNRIRVLLKAPFVDELSKAFIALDRR
jgi:hypothetical protein